MKRKLEVTAMSVAASKQCCEAEVIAAVRSLVEMVCPGLHSELPLRGVEFDCATELSDSEPEAAEKALEAILQHLSGVPVRVSLQIGE